MDENEVTGSNLRRMGGAVSEMGHWNRLENKMSLAEGYLKVARSSNRVVGT